MKQKKFLIGAVIIVGTLGWLGFRGAAESKAYYHTIAELDGLRGSAARQRMRVAGDVRPGSIEHLTGRVDFVIVEQEHADALRLALVVRHVWTSGHRPARLHR